jgi:hypothetical protein
LPNGPRGATAPNPQPGLFPSNSPYQGWLESLSSPLPLLAPRIANALKQTEKRLRGFLPAAVLAAFELFCDGCVRVLLWTEALVHTAPTVKG